jgi:N-dimethylarginine dimethylaminohydrolase
VGTVGVGAGRAARAGAEVLERPGEPGLSDMVFAMNHGLVDGQRAVVSRFRPEHRCGEQGHAARWFTEQGFALVDPTAPPQARWESGEAFLFNGTVLATSGVRSTPDGWEAVARALDIAIVPLTLTGGLYYHLDTCFCPLDSRRALLAPAAFTPDSLQRLLEVVPEPFLLDEDEAHTLVANSCIVGDRLVMPACPPRVGRWLEQAGFAIQVVDTSEFERLAGAVRCLTLPLDTDLSSARTGAPQPGADLHRRTLRA